MNRLMTRAAVLAASSLISLGAAALPLSEYNLIVADDFTHQKRAT